jgi:hypothetical protein
MYGQHGALSFDTRHFIAIMAATRHKCFYLVKQQEREFILQNGQQSWLSGIDYIPNKLKDLFELNKLLCHQPWLINQSHIQEILKSSNSWTLTELITAITILIHFHALSGFVFSLGINENYLQQLSMQNKQLQDEKHKKRFTNSNNNSKKMSTSEDDVAELSENDYYYYFYNEKSKYNQDMIDSDNEEEDDEDDGDDDMVDEDFDQDEADNNEKLENDESSRQTINGDGIVFGAMAASCSSNSRLSARARSSSTGGSNRTFSDSVS